MDALGFVDRDRIVAGGWSVGALAAMLLADPAPGRIRGIVSLDGAPGYDYGVELARRASRDQPQIKVMFITGFAAVALRGRSGMPGDPKILSKPFHLKDLVSQIDQLLAQRQPAGA